MVGGGQSYTLALALALLLLARHTEAHGVLLSPRSRNWIAYLDKHFDWADGLNAGGNKVTSQNGTRKWPRGWVGMCGDAYNERIWSNPGPVQATYVSGQTISVDFLISTNHLGRISMLLCPEGATSRAKCQYLLRADKPASNWYLPSIAKWTGGNKGTARPLYNDGSFSWYPMPSIEQPWGCTSQRLCNQFQDMTVYRVNYKLPSGFTCNRCFIMWQYLTAHSCWPPCMPSNANEVTCRNQQVYPTCGTPGTTYPEEFMNCADVSIAKDSARINPSSGLPPWNRAVKLASGKSGKPVMVRMGH